MDTALRTSSRVFSFLNYCCLFSRCYFRRLSPFCFLPIIGHLVLAGLSREGAHIGRVPSCVLCTTLHVPVVFTSVFKSLHTCCVLSSYHCLICRSLQSYPHSYTCTPFYVHPVLMRCRLAPLYFTNDHRHCYRDAFGLVDLYMSIAMIGVRLKPKKVSKFPQQSSNYQFC